MIVKWDKETGKITETFLIPWDLICISFWLRVKNSDTVTETNMKIAFTEAILFLTDISSMSVDRAHKQC